MSFFFFCFFVFVDNGKVYGEWSTGLMIGVIAWEKRTPLWREETPFVEPSQITLSMYML